MNKTNVLKELRSYVIITVGVLIMAVGIYFFKFPNNFSTGGVSGISTILGEVSPVLSKGVFTTIINVALLIIGLIIFGKSFAFKTVYASLVLSALIAGFEQVLPMTEPLTDQRLLELIVSVLLVAVGSALLFTERASSGGTDIVAMILKKYTSLDTGKALLCTDFLITVVACFVFGLETGMYSMLGLIAKAFVVDNFIDSLYVSKHLSIVTDKSEDVCKYIVETLHRSATVLNCEGTYTHTKKKMVITVLTRSQAVELKDYIKKIEPGAFIITTNSSDILGKGFRENVG